ncbi:MAG: hypothetical protein ABF647_05330, partial [Acetobacter orientalis]
VGRETKPGVTNRGDEEQPQAPFVSIRYEKRYYWIAKDDFDSKLAFTMLQILLELSKTTKNPGAIVTIPISK